MQDASVGDASAAGVKSDQRQPTPESSSLPAGYAVNISVPQSQWSGYTDLNWTSAAVQPAVGSASVPAAAAVSLAPGSVLPLNLLPAELSSVLGMAPSTAALSSATLPVSWLLPGGILVSADNESMQDPLANLSRLSTGMHNIVPTTNVTHNSLMPEMGKMLRNTNGAHTKDVKIEQGTAQLYGAGRQTNASVQAAVRPVISVPEPSRLPGRLENVYAPVQSEYLQQASTVGSQLTVVTEPPQPLSSSLYSPALQQLLQQGTASRTITSALPAYTKVSENSVPVGGSSSPATVESTVVQSSGRRRWTSADGAVWNRRNCYGYPDHSDNVDVNFLRQESSGFDISKNSSSPIDSHLAEPLPSNRDVAEFSAPSGTGLHHKFRRKNRPQPLIIPSPVSNFGFQSRLRSPRISEQSGPQLSVETSSSAGAVSLSVQVPSSAGLTPYTPPPMLSPVRTGSGLFCSLVQPSPKSAPVGFRLGLLRGSK